jgi:hypothetical protein
MKALASAGALVVSLLASSIGAAPAFQATSGQPVDKPFGKGGVIRMKLTAGDYRIAGRLDDRIRVAWRVDRPGDGENLKADADIRGTTAVIATSGASHGVHFTIDVPSRSDIDIDLTAGDLEIRGIEGNKQVESWAGDMSIDVGQPDQYRDVEASVRAGDLSALPFKVSKGGLLRSFKWSGKGPYSLRVKLFAGDLTLR